MRSGWIRRLHRPTFTEALLDPLLAAIDRGIADPETDSDEDVQEVQEVQRAMNWCTRPVALDYCAPAASRRPTCRYSDSAR